jgi:tol-pal system protein YbgF
MNHCHGLRISVLLASFTGALLLPASPVAAASKEQLQMMADLRILQEQAQQLQLLIGGLNDALKTVNTRLDQQAETNRRSFAEQKLGSDNLQNDLRVIREKMDDSNVRLGSLTQEVDALRQNVQQINIAPPPVVTDAGSVPPDGVSGPPPTAAPTPLVMAAGASPQRLWDSAYADYTTNQFDLAIQGFESYIRSFPRSDRAADAQVYIGNSYLQAGKNDKAVDAYEVAIRTYPNSAMIPEAWYKKGTALLELKEPDRATESFQFLVKTFPDSAAAGLARQQLARQRRP